MSCVSELHTMQTTILLELLLVTALYWYAFQYLVTKHDPRESPFVGSRVPLVGHLIGLIRHRNDYYFDLR